MVARERRVEPAHKLGRTLAAGADYHAVRTHEIVDRIAFLEKLRIAHHIKIGLGATPFELSADRCFDLVRGADRYR